MTRHQDKVAPAARQGILPGAPFDDNVTPITPPGNVCARPTARALVTTTPHKTRITAARHTRREGGREGGR